MNMFSLKASDRIILAGIALLVLLGLGILTFVSQFVHPNVEDILIAQKSRDQGVFVGAANMLMSYDGRYFTNILHGLHPLVLGRVEWYGLLSLYVLVFVVATFSFLARRLIPELPWPVSVLTATLLLLLVVAIAPSIPFLLFYHVSALVYLLPWGMLCLWTAQFMEHLQRPADKKWFWASAFSLLCANGLNEMFFTYNLCSLVALRCYIERTPHLHNKRQSWTAVLVIFLGSLSAFVLSPGISNRLADYSDAASLSRWSMLRHSAKEFFNLYSYDLMSQVPIILPTVLLIAVAINSGKHRIHVMPIGLLVMLSAAGVLACYVSTFAFYFTIGSPEDNSDRIYNSVFIGLTAILTMVAVEGVAIFRKTMSDAVARLLGPAALLCLAIALTYFPHNFGALLSELDSGVIQRYDMEMDSRDQLLADAKRMDGCKVVILDTLVNRPSSIWFHLDIGPNRKEPYWNRGMERYFRVDEVRLKGDTITLYRPLR